MKTIILVLVLCCALIRADTLCICDCYDNEGNFGAASWECVPAHGYCQNTDCGSYCPAGYGGQLAEGFWTDNCPFWGKNIARARANGVTGDIRKHMLAGAAGGVLNAIIEDEERDLTFTNATMYHSTCPSWSQLLSNGITGGQMQDCINQRLFEKSESWLEDAACDYVTGGLAGEFCGSVLNDILDPINSVVNKLIEKPIVQAADDVEDAIADVGETVVKTIWNWL